MVKKIFKIVIPVLISIFILMSVIIHIANNCITGNIVKELKAIDIPIGAEYIDSVSITGNVLGNGTDMQYFGALLISSDMSEAEIKEYYNDYSTNEFIIGVRSQKTTAIFDDPYYNKKFDRLDTDKNNYMVYCIQSNDSQYEQTDFFSQLLDMDLRSH